MSPCSTAPEESSSPCRKYPASTRLARRVEDSCRRPRYDGWKCHRVIVGTGAIPSKENSPGLPFKESYSWRALQGWTWEHLWP